MKKTRKLTLERSVKLSIPSQSRKGIFLSSLHDNSLRDHIIILMSLNMNNKFNNVFLRKIIDFLS